MDAGSWTALEVTKVVVAAATPIVVVLIGVGVSRTARRIEQAQWASRKVIERRLELYEEMAGPLNDLYCFFALVGHFRDITPPAAVTLKRQLDRVFHPNEFLMGTEFADRYRDFMGTCFQTYTGFAQDAKLRASPGVQRSERRTWDAAWDRCFVAAADDVAPLGDVAASYRALMLCFAAAIGVPPAASAHGRGVPSGAPAPDERRAGTARARPRPAAAPATQEDPAAVALATHDEVNRLLSKSLYDPRDCERILALLDRLGLLEADDAGEYAVLRQVRGTLLARRPDGQVEIVATGRADWLGGVELR